MKRSVDKEQNTLGEYVLHLGAGFVAKERPYVVAALSTLRLHLSRWDPREVSLEVSLQDRGRREQRVTLRTTLPGLAPLVAVADNTDIACALRDAKCALIRQLEDRDSHRGHAELY
jgi:hypothetical protein